jgi:hypothetical protein
VNIIWRFLLVRKIFSGLSTPKITFTFVHRSFFENWAVVKDAKNALKMPKNGEK